MKVITLKQPWATLVAEGYKKYEFRSWKCSYRGKILIHAGKGVDKEGMSRAKKLGLTDFPTSKILAEVTLTDCILIDNDFNKKINKLDSNVYGNKDRDGYAWNLENVKKINSNKIISGKLGLWNYEEDY